MIKMSRLTAALLFASVSSVVYAAETSSQPAQPASQGAASVENLTANKSGGHADKGLTNAEAHITATHGKGEKSETNEAAEGKGEKAEHLAHLDHPAKPDHLAKPDRPVRPERVGR